MSGVHIKRGNLDTDTGQAERLVNMETDRGGASPLPGTRKIASNPPEARREAWKRFSLTDAEGTNPDPNFQPPEV